MKTTRHHSDRFITIERPNACSLCHNHGRLNAVRYVYTTCTVDIIEQNNKVAAEITAWHNAAITI